MKTSFLILVYLLSVGCSCALTLQELQKSFRVERLKVENDENTKISSLRANYSKALSKIQTKYQRAGRLDDALKIKEEITMVQGDTSPLPPLAEKPPVELSSARKIFFKQSIAIRKKSGNTLIGLATKMDKLLSQKVLELTKLGNLEKATEAREYRKKLKEDQVITAAHTLINRVRSDGSSSVALRIRRAGDDLEVHVRYDARGKVSLESPVENVVEKSGGKKEKGETSAKNLGEFIGAKGYIVDPFVSYSNDFRKKDIGRLRLTSLELGLMKEDEGEVGTRITIPANAQNPHGKISEALPALAQKGTYKVNLRYFVPKQNKSIKGLQFVQGVGGPIRGSITQKTGVWSELDFTSTSLNENDYLLLYLRSDKKRPLAAIAGDYVSISDVTISHIAFTACIVERFDKDGAISESSISIDQQKAIAQNGSILPF
ncbi:MAG: hypothetical protein OSA93_15300 [Akkermansiaceae bacterium]|nr:hypothetical protein [Akkermansiaceae bacterium]